MFQKVNYRRFTLFLLAILVFVVFLECRNDGWSEQDKRVFLSLCAVDRNSTDKSCECELYKLQRYGFTFNSWKRAVQEPFSKQAGLAEQVSYNCINIGR